MGSLELGKGKGVGADGGVRSSFKQFAILYPVEMANALMTKAFCMFQVQLWSQRSRHSAWQPFLVSTVSLCVLETANVQRGSEFVGRCWIGAHSEQGEAGEMVTSLPLLSF